MGVFDDYAELTTTSDATAIFVNPVQVENLYLQFKYSPDKSEYESMNIYLTDSEDKSQRIKLSYLWNEGISYFVVNDTLKVKIPANTATSDSYLMQLNYVNSELAAYPHTSKPIKIGNYIDGTPFEGFSSNRAYVEFEFEGVNGVAGLILYTINNQPMWNFEEDFFGPQIFANRANGDVSLGSKVAIYGANAYDVLANTAELTVRVIAPSRTVVKSDNGVALDETCDASQNYVITVSEYGSYQVIFTAKDTIGNTVTYRYGFTVKDLERPVITVDTTSTNGKLGKNEVRTYSVSDNYSVEENLSVYIIVIDPNYSSIIVSDGIFEADTKGVYTVSYYCYDEAGNTTIESYKVYIE